MQFSYFYCFAINFVICFVCSIIRTQAPIDSLNHLSQSESSIDSTNSSDYLIDSNKDTNLQTQLCLKNHHEPCSQLSLHCYDCAFNYSCVYGQQVNTTCWTKEGVNCSGASNHTRTHLCSFCYQLPSNLYNCSLTSSCKLNSRHKVRCQVNESVLCLGNRVFYKYKLCKFSSGYKWSTALLLSITLGGFGVDRFYLGNWQEGIGKLFSFGGLGVWTLVDVILIATGYIKPADGSVFI